MQMIRKTTAAAFAATAALAAIAAPETTSLLNIAHRGLWDREVPQNTVEAIRRAYEAGAKWVETDFHHTKAGQMVCIHAEKELKRYTGCEKKIVDLTPEDIATLDLGSKDGLSRKFRIPLLDEVLALVPKNGVLQAEIKGYSSQYADIFDAAVRKAGLSESNFVVSSFNYEALKDFKSRYPKYRVAWLAGLPRDRPFQVEEYIAKCKDAKFEEFCPGCVSTKGVMTKADADAVRAAGLGFRVFGVNTPDDLRQAVALGASGFTCNFWRDAFTWAKAIGVACVAAPVSDVRVVRDIAYDPAIGKFGLGDLYLPEKVTPETPVVLAIHGGGWGSGDRYSWSGVAEFFCRELGCVAFNIEYRLASATNRWPACGDDCVKAANWLFTDDFRKHAGFTPKKIYVCGGSAGGHLALWTLVSMPPDKMAGCISISAIGDPESAYCTLKGCYHSLFAANVGKDEFAAMNPILKIKPGMAPVLCTHATEDKVVPIASHRAFADAYRASGNECDFFEYSGAVQPGLKGHCIWVPGSKPHRLIPLLAARIAAFMDRERRKYVPEPQPVKSSVEITALYYPGTEHMPEWDMVAQTRPEIKPLLGWYDEGNPEVVDWQIKWAVEHGITSFCVDWYWEKGHRRLEHWVKAYYKARYRKYLKWFMMYANHNAPGSHSTEDQKALTRYWIDNYFKTPEYYTIDGKPAVCIWDPNTLDADFIAEAAAHGEHLEPGEGVKRAFAISEKMVRDAGLPGISWIDMWRSHRFDLQYAERRRAQGYVGAMDYGLTSDAVRLAPEAVKPGEDARRFSFDVVASAMPKLWNTFATQDVLPCWLSLPTGWDARPRYFERSVVIRDRTPEKFAAVCRAAREFCERHCVKRVVVHPVNEWQEGSYVEPNEEFGFAMYDAIRDAFCEKPAAGWPPNLVPKDVGLGPYDYPPMARSSVPRWGFDSGSAEGWYRQPYGAREVQCRDGCLVFDVTHVGNFNIRQRMVPFPASRYGSFSVRMRITPNVRAGLDSDEGASPTMRLKWGTTDEPIIGKDLSVDTNRCVASCLVKADGEWHEYELPLAGRLDWKGEVNELWFEAVNMLHARVAIDWMRFVMDDAPTKVERRKPLTANVGVVSVGLDTYWKQCPGLYEDMLKKAAVFERRIESHEVKVSSFGISDNPQKAASLVSAMKAADLDLLFVDMVTYATSSTFAPFVRELNCPIVLVALQPDARLDYEHATIYRQLYNDDLCSVPEFTGVAIRYGRPVADVVIGRLEGDVAADEEIRQWCAVAHVLHDLRRARIGLMGHVLEAMYDMQVDPTAVSRTFGCHVALCEPDELLPFYRSPDAAAVDAMKKRILSFFDTPDPVSDPWTEKLTAHDLDVAAKAACALEKFIDKRGLDGFAYYYEGEPGSQTRELVTNFIVGNSLLTAAGFPMCGEFDLKNCVAMMIFDRLDIGGSFAEFHPIDFERGTVLVGHDGPHHLNIAAKKPVLRSLKKYHGKPGSGAGVEFSIKEGPITMMSLGLKADGSFKFIVAEGESLAGPIPPTGNTNTHGLFKPDVRTFLRRWSLEGPTHHFALGVGHHASELKKLGRALGVETVVVTE